MHWLGTGTGHSYGSTTSFIKSEIKSEPGTADSESTRFKGALATHPDVDPPKAFVPG